jgi:dihydrofolate reductase / thymidylate synthase
MKCNRFSIIAACFKKDRIIGINNSLPWKPLKEDMDFFRNLTVNTSNNSKYVNSVIMGKNTWLSLPNKYRPLPNRVNIIISNSLLNGRDSGSIIDKYNLNDFESRMVNCTDIMNNQPIQRMVIKQKNIIKENSGKIHVNFNPFNNVSPENNVAFVVRTLEEALNIELPLKDSTFCSIENRFVIGGERLFKESLSSDLCSNIYLTEVNEKYIEKVGGNNSVAFPKIPRYFKKEYSKEGNTKGLEFITYKNISNPNSQEKQYVNLMTDILKNGSLRTDRTGVGTFSVFGKHLTFSMENGEFPLLTTKNVWFKGVVEELLFFLRGDHDNRKLQKENVHIWDGNTSKEYLRNSNREHINEHDLGLAYGVQWRAAGAKLENIDSNYVGKGIDQVSECIRLINEDPYSRRIIINAWNVPQLKDMSLVPCHMMYQFYVRPNENKDQPGFLDCMMTQRSSDSFLGLPFNIASTATLTHIFAKATGYKPGKITINLGDAHIYSNHVDQVKTQLKRNMMVFPTLNIKPDIKNIRDIENLKFEDFELENYNRYPTIKADMAV